MLYVLYIVVLVCVSRSSYYICPGTTVDNWPRWLNFTETFINVHAPCNSKLFKRIKNERIPISCLFGKYRIGA